MPVSVQFIADGYQVKQLPVTPVAGETVRLNAALTRLGAGEASLYGRVVDAVSGLGLATAAVTCGSRAANSASDGAYVIAPVPVPPTAQDVGASHAGYNPLLLTGIPFVAGKNLQLDLGLLSLGTPSGQLHGYVFDAFTPTRFLPGALISVGRYFQTRATEPRGEYRLTVAAATTYAATGSKEGYLPLTFEGVRVGDGKTLELDFPLISFASWGSPGQPLVVTVVEAGSNRILPGAKVDTGAVGHPAQTTGADGTTTFTNLPQGDYLLVGTKENFRVGTVTATVGSATTPATATIELRGFPDNYSGGQLYGRVTAALIPPGRPIERCTVSASPPFPGSDELTGADGFYLMDEAPAGAYDVLFDHPDYVLYQDSATVRARAATRLDATLVPWDGRIPPGWRILYVRARIMSRPVGAVVVSLPSARSVTALRRLDTQAYVAGEDTLALARYRRVRYDNRAERENHLPLVKLAVTLAPGVVIEGVGFMSLAFPRPKAEGDTGNDGGNGDSGGGDDGNNDGGGGPVTGGIRIRSASGVVVRDNVTELILPDAGLTDNGDGSLTYQPPPITEITDQ